MLRHLMSAVVLSVVFSSSLAQAHCDTLDGPVVQAAQKALQAGDVTPVLRWVTEKDEAQLKTAFSKTLLVRAQGADARELADQFFFETLVRLHREGEGVPYTGVKPRGTEVEEGILAADRAMETHSAEAIKQHLIAAISKSIDARFARAIETAKNADQSVAAGREAVAAYVDFMHYVEALHAAATTASHSEHAAPGAHHAESPAATPAPAAHHTAPHAAPPTSPAEPHTGHEH